MTSPLALTNTVTNHDGGGGGGGGGGGAFQFFKTYKT